MQAERLISKVNFKVDNSGLSDHNGKFIVDSLFLKNSPKEYYPFDALKTEGLKDFVIDIATMNDVTVLNNGSTASFYTLENPRGTLLPDNTDPWKKVPSNISGNADRCTYLEVTGRYRTDGGTLRAPATYRLYIGSDATTNFDLNRNEIYNVSLCPSDEGIEKTSWKISVGGFEDDRYIKFNPDTLKMSMSSSASFLTVPYPSGMECTVSGWQQGTRKLTVTSAGGNKWNVTGSGKIENDTLVYLPASSWDGRTTAALPVKLLARAPVSLTVSPDSVVKETGELQSYAVTVKYDDGETVDVTADPGTTYASSDTDIAAFGTGANKHVATARNGGKATVTVTFKGKTATATFITNYPESLTADCPGYGGTGDWKWDFYKIGASATPTYTVTAKYFSGRTKTLSTSEYTVSNNTGSSYVDFSTKGKVKMVGSNVNTGCKASVTFLYTEAGKTVSLTKTWWKLYVTKVYKTSIELFYGYLYAKSVWCDCSKDVVYITYNDNSNEYMNFSDIPGTTGLELVNSAHSRYLGVSGWLITPYRWDWGNEIIVRPKNNVTYRGHSLAFRVYTFDRGCVEATGTGGTHYFSGTELNLNNCNYSFKAAYQDVDGYHLMTNGDYIFSVEWGSWSETYTTSVSTSTLLNFIRKYKDKGCNWAWLHLDSERTGEISVVEGYYLL